VRFLIDQNLGHQVSRVLNRLGHNSVHVRDRNLGDAPDRALVELARREDRIVVTVDKDFEKQALRTRSREPSVIRVRYSMDPRLQDPINVAARVHEVTQRDAAALNQGSAVQIRRDDYAIAPMPVQQQRDIDSAPTKKWRGNLEPPRRQAEHTRDRAPIIEGDAARDRTRHRSR
jgi:hypothetical protein